MTKKSKLSPLVIEPQAGRTYPMGRMSAVFKADLEETDGSLSVYVEGKDWFDAKKGSYIYIPGDTEHAFENRSKKKVGFMSINTPGGFEQSLPHIVDYFEVNPLGDANASS